MLRFLLFLTATVVASTGSVGWLGQDNLSRESDGREAFSYLIAGDLEFGRPFFEAISSTTTRSAFADEALLWWRLADGSADPRTISTLAASFAKPALVPRSLVLRALLSLGHANEVDQLLSAADPGAAAPFRVLHALARLESGSAAAADLSADLPIRIRETARWAAERASLTVFDRRGRLLGAVQPSGVFEGSDRQVAPDVAALISELDHRGLLRGNQGRRGRWLTIDTELSSRLRQTLDRRRGSVVIVDLNSGAVLAAVSDPATTRIEGAAALNQTLEPASIAKLITASAALRAGLDLDDEIREHRCFGSVLADGKPLYCPVVAGRLAGLDQALAWSCNSTFARLGMKVGWESLLSEFERFGFQTSEVPGSLSADSTVIDNDRNDWALAELAIGLNQAALTPLAAARLAAVFGSGGKRMREHWVAAESGALGIDPKPVQSNLEEERIVSALTATRIIQAMRSVVEEGTAAGVDAAGFPAAMKTGTASEPGRGFLVNYIGVAPLPAPRYAFAVRVTDQPSSARVRRRAREITAEVLRQLARWDREELAQQTRFNLGPAP